MEPRTRLGRWTASHGNFPRPSADETKGAPFTPAKVAKYVALLVAIIVSDFVALAIAATFAPDGPSWIYMVIQMILLLGVLLLISVISRRRRSLHD